MTGHDAYEKALSAFALDALDESERRGMETHLETCVSCRTALVEFGRVTAGLALSVEPEAPPADLRARTLARATTAPRAKIAVPRASAAGARNAGWLTAAAAAMLVVGLGTYTWSLWRQVDSLEAQVARAARQMETLTAELVDLRRDSATLRRTVSVLAAPDVITVALREQGGGPPALGSANWSATAGLVVGVEGLPVLAPDRVYQLWVVPSDSGPPVSAGFLTMEGTRRAAFAATAPAVSARPAAFAVTVEPAGGSPSPTTPIILAGEL